MADSIERELAFRWQGLTLAGTLHISAQDGPQPAVLMMQGSGPADRDCGGYFPLVREAFLTRGIAAYAFDKPGCGESTGDWRDYALEARADQALAALQLLREHSAVDAGQVGIWGQSQGGWLVQIVAAGVLDLAFAIANSGPAINVVEQDLYGCEHLMRSGGHSESDIEQALAFISMLHEAAQRGVDFPTIEAQFLQKARQQPWYGYTEVEDAADWRFGRALVREGYEPRDALVKIRCPMLAIFGGRDVLLPAWQSAEETGRALQEAGNADATVVVFAGADHRIRDVDTEEFATGYVDLLGDWAARRV